MRKSEAATRPARAAVALVAAALLVLPPSVVFAAPQGAQVQHGSASFETQGSTTVIRTSTPVTIIDYKSFDIGRSEAVHIHQPTAASRVMNKVLPTDPTRIDGELWSNGQVYILNAAGIFFGNEAVVDVGRLVAAAGSLSNADFIAGVDHFTDLSGAVGNDGVIEADSVTLIGRTVANHGTILAEDGMIALVAGDEVILSKIEGRVIVRVDGPGEDPGEFAVQQTGTLDAGRGSVSLTAGDTWSLAINHSGITRGGDIRLEAESGVVQVAGVLDAANRGSTAGVGGRIEVTGEKVAIGDALLDASGEAGGGEIHVGGDVGGAGALANARRTYVSPDAVLRADADGTGDGGEIVVWSDEWTVFRGAASARGGASAGDGGFVEISGHALEATGQVDLAAPAGRGGTLLYDPERIEIVGGTQDGTDVDEAPETVVGDDGTLGAVLLEDEGVFDEDVPEGTFVIYESEIEGTTAEVLILEAEKSVTATGTFDGSDVQLAEEVILSIGTLGSADETTGADDLRGIDLSLENQDLVWKAGAGGAIVLVTGADGSNEADIRADRLEARGPPTGGGASIFVAAAGGDVEIDQIDTSADVDPDGVGPRRAGGPGGTVTIFTSGADRDVTIGSIETRGGDAVAADPLDEESSDMLAGNGGSVLIQPTAAGAATGSVTVGRIDTSGGSATDEVLDFEDGPVSGFGGSAGAITIVAQDGDILLGDETDPGDTAILANGGAAWMADRREDATVQGGTGGSIDLSLSHSPDAQGHVIRVAGDIEAEGGDLSKGIVADQGTLGAGGGGGRIILTTDGVVQLGMPDQPIRIALSGGDVAEQVDPQEPENVGNGGFGGRLDATLGGGGVPSGMLVNAAIEIRGGTSRNGISGPGGAVAIESSSGPIVGLSDGAEPFAATLDVSGGDALGSGTTEDAQGVRQFSAVASGGGDVAIRARDGVTWGTITSRTGSAPGGTVASAEQGGSGGTVSVTAEQGSLSIAGVDVSGGSAGGVSPDGESKGRGGDGGQIELVAFNTDGRADVVLVEGTVDDVLLIATAGAGADETTRGEAGRIGLGADTAILVDDPDAASSPYAHIAGGEVVLFAQAVGAADAPLRFAGAGTDSDSVAIQITQPPPDTEDSNRTRVDEDVHTSLAYGLETGPGVDLDDLGDPADPDVAAVLELLATREQLGEVDRFALRQVVVEGETIVKGGWEVTRDAGGLLQIDPAATDVFVVDAIDRGGEPGQRISTLDTQDHVTAIEYRLDLPSTLGSGAFPRPDVEIALGARVGSGGLLLATRGQILGQGDGTHITTMGDLTFGEARLEPTRVAAESTSGRLEIETDAAPLVALTVAGDVGIDVSDDVADGNADGLADRVDGVAIIQKSVGASVDIALPGGDVVDIDGDATASTSTLVQVTTTANQANQEDLDFLYELGGGDEAGAPAAAGDVIVESAQLGGTTILIARGDIVLGEEGDSTTPIDARGERLALLATGEIRGTDDAVTHVADPGSLLLAGNEGAGSSAAPIRISGDEDVSLAAEVDTGDLALAKSGGGDLRVTEFVAGSGDAGDPFNLVVHGVSAGGDARLSSDDGDIVFTGDSERGTASFATAEAGGDLVLDGDVVLETFLAPTGDGDERVAVNDTRLVAGGDIRVDGSIESSDDPQSRAVGANLSLSAGGATTLGGDVGVSGGIARLATTDLRLARDVQIQVGHGDVAGGADFDGTIDGPGALTVRAVAAPDQGSAVVFRGDVGTESVLAGLDVDADRISFTNADRVVTGAGGIALNADRSGGDVPTVATITDAVGSVSFETTGAFATGDREKVSVIGDLEIRASDGASFGDLSADSIRVDSPEIVLFGRPRGLVQTATGAVVDQGVDLVANQMVFTSPIQFDGQGPTPTLVLGSGGVLVPGNLEGFRVIRFNEQIGAVTPSDFLGVASVFDLTGTGPPVVGDPAREIPQVEPEVVPMLPVRFDDTSPTPLPQVSEGELLAYLRCVELDGETPCGAAEAAAVASVPTTSPLATPRARQVAADYRRLLARPDARASLFASLSVALEGYRELTGPGRVDGAAFYRFVAESPPYRETGAQFDELARLFANVQLMGLPAAEVASVQRDLAETFAARAGVEGIDADVVTRAVEASGIGVPPPEQLRERI